jgi:hypothetical protein
MAPPYTGRCFCEAVRYRITEEPLTFYACHCTDCLKRSGSAFGLSLWVNRAAIEVTHGDATLPSGESFFNPMRVVANGQGSELLFTLFRHPPMTEAEFDEDAKVVLCDLEKLKAIIEALS